MRLILDRIEKNAQGTRIAVFEMGEININVDENSMPKGLMDKLGAGIIIEAEYENGKILKAQLLIDETEKKRSEMKSRLAALKNRNKR